MAPREINISYGITGEITLTVTWKPSSLDDALASIRDFIARLKGEQPKTEPKPVKVQPKQVKTKPKQTHRTHHCWTDEERAEAMRLYAEGENIDIIAEKFGSTNLAIQKMMQKYKVRRPGYGPRTGHTQSPQVEEQPKDEPV